MKLLIVLAFMIFLSAPGQAQHPTNKCYRTDSLPGEFVFRKMDIYPAYKGHVDLLNQFLIKHIDADKILLQVSENIRYISDTVEVKFVIRKTGLMSDLSVVCMQNPVLKDEVEKAFIKSSCNWDAGSSGGRNLHGEVSNKLIYTLDRRGSFFSIKISWLNSFVR